MEQQNKFKISVPAISINEGFIRNVVSAFVLPADPTIEELTDIKAAVSEAVTNSIVHAYGNEIGTVEVSGTLTNNQLYIKIKDKGCGIEDIEKAMQPLFTTSPESERAGLGFAVMQSFTDKVKVCSKPDKGTTVSLWKRFKTKYE